MFDEKVQMKTTKQNKRLQSKKWEIQNITEIIQTISSGYIKNSNQTMADIEWHTTKYILHFNT